jgi:hypothetical protein
MKIIPEAKREPPIIRVHLLKRRRREVKVDPKLGGQWNVPSLVANGMFQAWWPLECSKLGGHWNVPCLVANGMFQAWWPLEGSSLVAIGRFQAWWPLEGSKLGGHWKVKEKPFSPLPFFPNNFTYTLNFFPLTSRFYFTMVLSRYSRLSFLFFNL